MYVETKLTGAGLRYYFTEKGVEKLKELVEKRWTRRDMADALGVTVRKIDNKITELKLSRPAASGWTEERVELLKKLWSEGLSCSQIAGRLGAVSRNSVIGKVHRLGLSGRATTSRMKTSFHQRPSRAVKRAGGTAMRWGKTHSLAPVEPAPLPPEPPTPDKLVSFADLEPGMCRFIFGDPRTPEHGFCGCKTAPGATYCPGHQALCTSRAEPTRRRITHIPSTNAGIVSADKALEAIQ